MFVNIKHLELIKFKYCQECDECCKNKLLAPLVLEDFEKVYEYFPIVIAKLDTLRIVMLLSNEKCPYLKNSKCSIYDKRPPACKIYPYSPWYGEILLDISCPGIGIKGEKIPLNKEEFLKSPFYDERFENISEKLKNSFLWLKAHKLKFLTTYKGIKLYTLKNGKDKFFKMHQKSLTHLHYYL